MKLALITGGSRGLGAALCGEYLSQGWHVVEFSRGGVAGRRSAAPDDTAARTESVAVDFADPAAAEAALGVALTRLAERDYDEVVAVANAGTLHPIGRLEDLAPADIRANLDVNLVSQILFARCVASTLRDHVCPKTFVAVSSGAATKGYAGWSLYCAAKAALESFVRAVALEQSERPHPIVAISVNPGVMDTAMQAAIRAASGDDFPARERFVGLHAAGGLRSPAAVASAIAEAIEQRPAAGSRIDLLA